MLVDDDLEDSSNGWSDEAFLAKARNGSKGDAYEMLVGRLSEPLRATLAARFPFEMADAQTLEEHIHEAAWKAVEEVAAFDPAKGDVLVWAFSLGVNLAIDKIRSEQARRAREAAVAVPVDTTDSDLLNRVLAAIRAMPKPFSDLLLLDLEYGGSAPAKVVAASLGVCRQTVYNLRREAHLRFKGDFS